MLSNTQKPGMPTLTGDKNPMSIPAPSPCFIAIVPVDSFVILDMTIFVRTNRTQKLLLALIALFCTAKISADVDPAHHTLI